MLLETENLVPYAGRRFLLDTTAAGQSIQAIAGAALPSVGEDLALRAMSRSVIIPVFS